MENSYLLSIGALSKATGIPIDTLRTWERRYGFPQSERTDAGHRRYRAETIGRLQLALKAMEAGHRPAAVLRADLPALRKMVPGADTEPPQVAPLPPPQSAAASTASLVQLLLDHALRFEGRALERELRRAWAELGGMGFIESCAAPLLVAVGEAWERGDLSVGHEHFASERLRDFLVQQWRPLSDTATGPYVVCAVLSGERHVLGLHLAATTLALHGLRVVFLGADAPGSDVARVAIEQGATAVVLSMSSATDPQRASAQLRSLRAALPAATRVLCGGGGVPGDPSGCEKVNSFSELARAAVSLSL